MSQDPTTGQYQSYDVKTLKAAGAELASADGAAVLMGDRGTLRVDLVVTASTAPTSLDVTLQTSADGTTWRAMNPAAAFTQIGAVATGAERKVFPGCDRYVRYQSVIVGTSYTYSIIGEAV